jgi:hypothetical protein
MPVAPWAAVLNEWLVWFTGLYVFLAGLTAMSQRVANSGGVPGRARRGEVANSGGVSGRARRSEVANSGGVPGRARPW